MGFSGFLDIQAEKKIPQNFVSRDFSNLFPFFFGLRRERERSSRANRLIYNACQVLKLDRPRFSFWDFAAKFAAFQTITKIAIKNRFTSTFGCIFILYFVIRIVGIFIQNCVLRVFKIFNFCQLFYRVI